MTAVTPATACHSRHHLATWFFVVFTGIHIYLSLFHDVVEAEGEISSMVSGTNPFPATPLENAA